MSDQTDQRITLTTGVTIPASVLNAIMSGLRSAFMQAPVAFHDLVQHCRTDGTYMIFGNGVERLRGFGLIQTADGPHESVCEVIAAAVEGEGFDMMIVSPRRDIV